MMDNTEPTLEEWNLQYRLQQRASLSVPIDVIKTWTEHERKWVEIWADNQYLGHTYRIPSNVAVPHCLKPFVHR